MKIHEWVVVISRAQAKIFKRTDTNASLQWVHNIVNPEGRLRNHEFEGHAPSLSYSKFAGARHPYLKGQKKTSAHEVSVDRFARKIAKILKESAHRQDFEKLYVFAEPHLLGKVRDLLSRALKGIEIEWVAKDLEKATTQQIQNHV